MEYLGACAVIITQVLTTVRQYDQHDRTTIDCVQSWSTDCAVVQSAFSETAAGMRACSVGLGFRVRDKVRVSVRDRFGVRVSDGVRVSTFHFWQWLRAGLPGTHCVPGMRAGPARHAMHAGLPLHHATTRHPSRVLTGAVWP